MSTNQIDVIFLGSSLVAGTLGYNWIKNLPKTSNVSYHNCGINGAQVPTIIDQLKSKCPFNKHSPENKLIVVLMVGGNDLTCSLIEKSSNPIGYEKMQKQRCGRPNTNPKQFQSELEELITLLKGIVSDNVPIGLCNIKPIGEDLKGKLNDIVREYNSIIENVAKENNQVTLIDVYTPLSELSEKGKQTNPNLKLIASDDINQLFNPQLMINAFLWNKISLGYWSLNALGESYGFYTTCDGSHFNERSGRAVKDTVWSYLESRLPNK